MALLEMRGIQMSFGAVQVLHDAELIVEKGSAHALLGENGAGKSTLMNILTGSLLADAGSVNLDGKDIFGASIKATETAGIAFVHQELNVFNDMSVVDNIFIGHEIVGSFGRLNKKEMLKRARSLFERLGVSIDPTAQVSDLRPSERQLLEIAKSLFFDAKLLVLDEPTTALNTQEVQHLFSIIKDLLKAGISFIFISHKMPEVFQICDSYTVMRNGHFIQSGKFSDVSPAEITDAMVGSALSGKELYVARSLGSEVLCVHNFSGVGFSWVSLSIKKGQILGLTGLQGSGASEFMQGLFGAIQSWEGTIKLKGKAFTPSSIQASMQAGLAYLASNRKDNSVIADVSILENQYISEHVLSAKHFTINKRAEVKKYHHLKTVLNLKAESPDAAITSLSGGNQQKVFLARWLNTEADILLLDNPTQGIDVGAKAEIYRLILELATQGKTILINTLEIAELREVADSCLVFYEGSVAAELTHDEIDERNVMQYSTQSVAQA
ncbi:sugar ABC transporter ATP-binding protein [Collinsella sp. zg1085]|uniref:sugar ABC transporter ATP-binding protein n=1 Tax=Collinsella sp. zg1085 TaxID=2844380 RepID=UPI001C0E7ABF|nr:sugar ABC transporter ATP-binding protein [Collinsella sp. zg1085]QWT18060.1 sugar ABC transporter ATP-binding protein [Collinsella sp. zg1085]